VLRKRGRRSDRQQQLVLETLRDRLGREKLERFCRWYLFDGDNALAAGAAIELFDFGERRLQWLSGALINALHDGGYIARAEQVLDELIALAGSGATEVVANHIAERRYDGLGGHSGWWRVLFRFIDDPRLRAPDLLVQCMRGVGEFLLARHPEIRHRFKELVLSPKYERFRSALHSALNDAEPKIRHGAAMVLVTSDPETEAQPLETVAQFISHRRHGGWYEWERFCVTLQFGPNVLAHLGSRLPTLSGASRTFALAVLYKNGFPVTEQQLRELVEGVLTTLHGGLTADDFAGQEETRKILLDLLDHGPEAAAVRN
jgi:hypothetical protein